jgi:hypothetical protein
MSPTVLTSRNHHEANEGEKMTGAAISGYLMGKLQKDEKTSHTEASKGTARYSLFHDLEKIFSPILAI